METFTIDTQRKIMGLLGFDIDAGNIMRMRMEPCAIFVEIEDGFENGEVLSHEEVLTLAYQTGAAA